MAAVGRLNGTDFCLNTKHKCKGCGACPHTVQGPATTGAKKTKVNGVPVLRIGDKGVHNTGPCCGPNKWVALRVSSPHKVLVEGKPIFCVGDISLHDGKDMGKLMVGSDSVNVGS